MDQKSDNSGIYEITVHDLVAGILGYKKLPDDLWSSIVTIEDVCVKEHGIQFNKAKTTDHFAVEARLHGKEAEIKYLTDVIHDLRLCGMEDEKRRKKFKKKIKKKNDMIKKLQQEENSWASVIKQVQQKCDTLAVENTALREDLIIASERADLCDLEIIDLTEKIEKAIADSQKGDNDHVRFLVEVLRKILEARTLQNTNSVTEKTVETALSDMQNATTG